MSLFFDDEIQKVKKRTDRLGLDNLMSQDPRDAESQANKYRRASHTQPLPNKNQQDSRKRPTRRRNSK